MYQDRKYRLDLEAMMKGAPVKKLIDPEKQAARREKIKTRIGEAVEDFREDHKIDADEIPALKEAFPPILIAGVRVAAAFILGNDPSAALKALGNASKEFLVVLAGALSD